MKILHLTDTHYINEKSLISLPQILQDVLRNQHTFEEKLEILSSRENLKTFDLVVVTGDLVHESDKENYLELFQKMSNIFGKIPIFYALGNHDIKQEFKLANNEIYFEDFYDYSIEFENKHIIILDSAKIGESDGSTTPGQLEWLDMELNKNNLPKLIFLHHPILGGASYKKYSFNENKKILEILSKRNVLGVFNGHTHQPAVHTYNNINQFTSYCFGFGISHVNVDKVLEFNDMTGYTVIEVEDVLTVQPRLITPNVKPLVSINRSEIKHVK